LDYVTELNNLLDPSKSEYYYYDPAPSTKVSVDKAIEVIRTLANILGCPTASCLFICPNGDGGIHLEWAHSIYYTFDIEISNEGKIDYYFRDVVFSEKENVELSELANEVWRREDEKIP
jgi:hypothetical protein